MHCSIIGPLLRHGFDSNEGTSLSLANFVAGFESFGPEATVEDRMGFVFELLCVLGGHDGESTDLTLAQAQAGIAALYGEADSQLVPHSCGQIALWLR